MRSGAGNVNSPSIGSICFRYGTDLLGAMHRHQSREFVIRAEAIALRDHLFGNDYHCRAGEPLGRTRRRRPGARAELIAVDGDPLADISLLDGQGEHLTHIMKDGVLYKKLP